MYLVRLEINSFGGINEGEITGKYTYLSTIVISFRTSRLTDRKTYFGNRDKVRR